MIQTIYEYREQQLTKAKKIIEELSKSLFLAKGIVRDLIDDTVDFKESKERAVYCYERGSFDDYREAMSFLKEEEMGKRNQNMRKSRFEEEAAEYIKTHDDYRVFALDDADIMQIFKDGAEIGFQKGIKAKINTTTISDAPIKAQSAEMACCDGEQDKPNVFQQFLEKELPEDIQRRVERAAEYGESNAEYFFRAGFFLAHELEEAKKNQDGGKR